MPRPTHFRRTTAAMADKSTVAQKRSEALRNRQEDWSPPFPGVGRITFCEARTMTQSPCERFVDSQDVLPAPDGQYREADDWKTTWRRLQSSGVHIDTSHFVVGRKIGNRWIGVVR